MIKITIKACTFFILILVLFSCNRQIPQPIPPLLFNDDWQFILAADSSEVFDPANKLAWEKVKLPHTSVIEPLVVNDQWQGICWYRKDFTLPSEAKGKNLFLSFEGAMNVAEVWINGVKKVTHLGGFLPFVVDFTAEANADSVNQVIVRLDNTDNPITGPKPLKQLDFNTYGGLYRDVFMIMENTVFITDPIFENTPGGGGIFVSYPEVSKERAVVRVQTHVRNTGSGDEKIEVRHQLIDPAGLTKGNVTETAENGSTTITTIELTSPLLWSPSTPHLYSLVTGVYSNGRLTDADTTRIGIRQFEIRKDRFAINGEEMYPARGEPAPGIPVHRLRLK